MKFINTIFAKLSESLNEVNSTAWSLTKIVMLVFMYPTLTGLFIFDTIVREEMDPIVTIVFICSVVAPRTLSQVLAARFGYKSKDGEPLDKTNSIDASPTPVTTSKTETVSTTESITK